MEYQPPENDSCSGIETCVCSACLQKEVDDIGVQAQDEKYVSTPASSDADNAMNSKAGPEISQQAPAWSPQPDDPLRPALQPPEKDFCSGTEICVCSACILKEIDDIGVQAEDAKYVSTPASSDAENAMNSQAGPVIYQEVAGWPLQPDDLLRSVQKQNTVRWKNTGDPDQTAFDAKTFRTPIEDSTSSVPSSTMQNFLNSISSSDKEPPAKNPTSSVPSSPLQKFLKPLPSSDQKSTVKNPTSSVQSSPLQNFLKSLPSSDQIPVVPMPSYDGSPLHSLISSVQEKMQGKDTSPSIPILPKIKRGIGEIQPPPLSAQNEQSSASTRSVQTGHVRLNTLYTPMSESQKAMQIKPMDLGPNRQDSIALFARPSLSKDESVRSDEYGNASMDGQGDLKRVSIHQHEKDGEHTEFEIDFEADSVFSNHIDPQTAGGFVNGNFTSGKLKEIETTAACFGIKFNLDCSLLAVALKDGHGVELYETQQFRLIHTIERSCTVSAMDWVEQPGTQNTKWNEGDEEIELKEPKTQLLAVGGFDGFVKVYSISMQRKDLVLLVDSFHVQSEICSLAFLKDSATQYAPNPRAIAVGEKNGRVSIVTLSEFTGASHNAIRIRVIDQADSAILSLSFGFSDTTKQEGGIIMVYGTKYGMLRASMLYIEMDDWVVSRQLFQLERTGAIRALRFNHDSSLLIVGGYDKTVLIIDAALWKVVRELYMDGTVQTVEFDPFNRYLLLGNRSKTMTVVDTSTLHPIKTFQTKGWVTSISWGGQSTIAMRSDDREVSLILFEPIQPLGMTLDSTRGEDCCISWSADGRFLARTNGNNVIIADSKRDFVTVAKVGDVARASDSDVYSCVKFCHATGKRDRLAIVGRDGFLKIVSLRVSVGKIHQQLIASVYVEKNLKSVAWSPDGTMVVCGGREMRVHMLDAISLKKRCDPVLIGGRIWMIDALSQKAYDDIGEYASSFGMAITSGRNICSVLDLVSNNVSMEITRKRTVRCQKYHPSLPVLAIGDGSSEVMVVDLAGERKLASFFVDGRVNTIAFSPAGDYIGVGTDEGTFTIHDTMNFKCVQEIRSTSIAMNIEFSGSGAQYVAISHANGDVKIIKLGPLLSIDYTPLQGMLDLPDWAKEEVMFRSPEGPSFLQRCMLEGSKESLICAESVLEEAPESVLTFDRTTGVGCFETAVELRKPNIMKLILTPVVDGTLDSRSAWSSSLLTTTMPVDGFLTLRDLIMNHPPGYATDILSKMTFMKVPFAGSRRCHLNDPKECGSASYTDPWGGESRNLEKQDSMHSRFGQDYKDEIVLIPAVLPLPGLGTLDFLSALLAMPNTGAELFDNDAMGLVLAILWNAGIKYYFFIDFFLNILFSILWIHFVDRSASSTASNSNDAQVITVLAWMVMLLNILFMAEQGVRFVTRRGNFLNS